MRNIGLVLIICACTYPGWTQIKDIDPYTFWMSAPSTPAKIELDHSCDIDASEIVRENNKINGGVDMYYHKELPFSGWACSIDFSNNHMYRYSLYKDGRLTWQIGFWANGELDHDFRAKEGVSLGSQRMWMEDGWPYIENYYSNPDVKDGLWRRWYTNHQIAYQALFENGQLVYEVEWNEEGTITNTEGQVPAHIPDHN
jgi:hypothetical protein